jgi:hypothetical protein
VPDKEWRRKAIAAAKADAVPVKHDERDEGACAVCVSVYCVSNGCVV